MQSHPFAILMFQKYWDNPLEGLIGTINYGGDCDTTGAMYGALMGAKEGLIFPEKLVRDLHNNDYLMQLGEKMWTKCQYNNTR